MPQMACDTVLYEQQRIAGGAQTRQTSKPLPLWCPGQEAAERNEHSVEMLCPELSCVIQSPSQSV